MKQINNNFADYYYLTESGKVINAKTNKEVKPHNYKFRLKTRDNKTKCINLKPLYKLVYGKNYCIDDIENLQGEEWRAIEDTNELYFVSNYGRIKSLQDYKAIILKPQITNNGYERLDIYIGGKRCTKLVHCLAAAAWLDKPQNLMQQIHHKDFNKLNNAADNLCYLSIGEHTKIHQEERRVKVNE